MFNIPILFVFFNRKDIAMQSFERIKAIRPSTLYLAQDGARQDRGMEEKEVIKELRQSIIDSIDWDCDVHTRFIEYNLGCANGVKTAIDWMFETEQYGIILEDSCMSKIRSQAHTCLSVNSQQQNWVVSEAMRFIRWLMSCHHPSQRNT